MPSEPGSLFDLRTVLASWADQHDPARVAGPEPAPDWHLDEHTRAVGRHGVAMARALLAGGRPTAVAPVPGDAAPRPSRRRPLRAA